MVDVSRFPLRLIDAVPATARQIMIMYPILSFMCSEENA